MLISETHFTSKSFFKIPNYTLYHTMHPDGRAHGGSAILIRSNIKHHQAQPYQKDYIQATSVVVYDWISKITVSSLYCPPRHTVKKEQFDDYFKYLGNRFIAGGDYNAKHTFWGSRLTLPRGRELFKSVQAGTMNVISTGQPTYWPSDPAKIPDIIDFCITKGVSKDNISCCSCWELSSDHSPILVEIGVKVRETTKKCTLHSNKTNWDMFRILVDEAFSAEIALETENDIMNAVEFFTTSIQSAAWDSTPIVQQHRPTGQCIPPSILNEIGAKRDLRKLWQQNRCPDTKKLLNHKIKKLKQILDQDRNATFQAYLKDLDATSATDYSLWKATRNIKRPTTISPPLRKADNCWARSDQEKAYTFAEHLSNVFQPHPYEGPADHEKKVTEYLKEIETEDTTSMKFTTKEVRRVIQKAKSKKSPGYDLITNKTLQELPDSGITMITAIYNAIVRLQFIPPQWKTAQIIMLIKPDKKPEDPKSYRPISLLPIPSKILETLILQRIMPLVEQHGLIPDHQFGFRQRHATVDQVHRLIGEIDKSFESKRYCASVFLDISQAFDRVWHEGLLFKIKSFFPNNIYKILKSFLENRYFLVNHGEAFSGLCNINAGVPQGSVLGPLLYLIYTSDLPTSDCVTTGTFADDTAILSSHEDPTEASKILQKGINDISTWLKKWRIKANETKSINVNFTLKKGICPPVTLNNVEIPRADHVRYLGLHLDKRLTWQKHIFTKRKQLGLQIRKYYWLIGRRSQLSMNNKLLLYNVMLKPIWTYGIQLWGTASHSNIEIVQRFQNKMLRMVTDAPWYVTNEQLHHDLQVYTVKQEILRHTKTYKERIINHPNRLAKVLMDETRATRRLKRKMPQDILKQ